MRFEKDSHLPGPSDKVIRPQNRCIPKAYPKYYSFPLVYISERMRSMGVSPTVALKNSSTMAELGTFLMRGSSVCSLAARFGCSAK